MEAIITILTIAISLGLTKVVDGIEEWISSKKEVTTDDILSTVDKVINAARSKGTATLDKLFDKLSKIPTPIGMSGDLQSYIQKVRREAANKYNRARKVVEGVEQNLGSISNKANILATSSAGFRSDNKDLAKKYEKEAKEELSKINDLEGVEKKINE